MTAEIARYVIDTYPEFAEYVAKHTIYASHKINKRKIATIREDLRRRFPDQYNELQTMFA